MMVTLDPQLAAALSEAANRHGVCPEELAIRTLREQFLPRAPAIEPRDEWERRLLSLARDCGVAPPHSALSSEELYD